MNMMQLDAARLEGVASSVHVGREGGREPKRKEGRGIENNGIDGCAAFNVCKYKYSRKLGSEAHARSYEACACRP